MKKRLMVALAVMSMAVVGLTACGGSGTTETAAETAAETEAIPEYERGTSTETGWESAWIGMKFTAGEGVVMQDEEAMDAILEAGSEEMGNDPADFEGLYTYEMMASDGTMGLPQVAMLVEQSDLTPDEYIDQMLEQLEAAFTAVGDNQDASTSIEMTQDGDVTDYELAGLTFRRLQMKASSQGVDMIQDYLICRRGDYLIEIISTALADQAEERDAMMACFTALE